MSEQHPPPDERPTLAKGEPPTRPYPPGPSPYEQVPYGGAPPPPYQAGFPAGYGPPAYPHPGAGFPPPPKHPSATTALTVGLIALCGGFFCGLPLVVAPWAWVLGSRTVREIDASGGTLGGRGDAQAGYVMGIIGTVMLVVGALFVLLYVVLVVGLFAGFLGVFSSA